MGTTFVNGIEVGPDGKEWAKTEAGYAHVETVRHKAHDGASPVGGQVWHGHAVREAFVAGAEWQEQRKAVRPAPVMKVSRLQEIVLLELASQDPETGVHSLHNLAVFLTMEQRDVRLAVRALARKGLAERTYLYDEYNSQVVGSGYMATTAGRQLAAEINKKRNVQ